MKQQSTVIKYINNLSNNVIQIVTEKPENLVYTPGQAIAISIGKRGWRNEIRPFSFTSIPANNYLEFIIKIHPSDKGVTKELLKLKQNDKLILHNIFGSISYKGEGIFIAGGTGINPFISIFRDLHSRNEIGRNILINANKTKDDIYLELELKDLFGINFINILSEENHEGYEHGLITSALLKTYANKSCNNFYVCGPPPMMDSIATLIQHLEVDGKNIIKEEF